MATNPLGFAFLYAVAYLSLMVALSLAITQMPLSEMKYLSSVAVSKRLAVVLTAIRKVGQYTKNGLFWWPAATYKNEIKTSR